MFPKFVSFQGSIGKVLNLVRMRHGPRPPPDAACQPSAPGAETRRFIRSLLNRDRRPVDTSGIWWNSGPFDSTAQVSGGSEGASCVSNELIAPSNLEKADGT